MRLVLFAFSPMVLLVVVSCTIENSQTDSDAGIAGSGNATGGARTAGNSGTGGSRNSAGGSNVAGSSNSAGSSVVTGGSSATSTGNGTATGGNTSTSGGAATGGNTSTSGGAATGGNTSTSGGAATGGNTSTSGGAATGGNTSTSGGAATGGNTSTSSGAATGGNTSTSSGAATGGNTSTSSGTATGGNASTSGGAATTGGIAATGGSGGGTGLVKALPPTTFVFERKVASGRDHLVAMDFITGAQRVITTLAEGSVAGWNIDGVTVSPDRSRIVIASLYGATAADNATGLATNRLWSLDNDGQDFRRLTPVFPNTHAGQTGWRIDVRDPAYSADGQAIVFDYGEGDSQGGYVAPWLTAADGSTLPSLFSTSLECSVNNNAAFNPATGDMLLQHAVCINGSKGGLYLYPIAGGPPDYLVNEDGVTMSGEPAAFSFDGSVFVYTARTYSDNIQSLYAYIMSERRVVNFVPGAVGVDIVNASFAPDNAHLVYCVKEGSAYNLRLVDLGVNPPTDSALTTDGISCDAVF